MIRFIRLFRVLNWRWIHSSKGAAKHNTGRRRPIGCRKLQVIFRQRATNRKALLRKMTYKDETSYGSSPHFMRTLAVSMRELVMLQVISAKEPLIIGLFCGKWPMKIRHPMGLCHPLWGLSQWVWESVSSCRSFSTKEPLIIGHFCGKWPIKIRHPMTLCHPLWGLSQWIWESVSSCRSFSTKEPLIIGHFCRNWPVEIRHPIGLCHPLWGLSQWVWESVSRDILKIPAQ